MNVPTNTAMKKTPPFEGLIFGMFMRVMTYHFLVRWNWNFDALACPSHGHFLTSQRQSAQRHFIHVAMSLCISFDKHIAANARLDDSGLDIQLI